MRYLRRKDDHTIIKGFGYVKPGGLGEFDENVYEEIEGRPPKGYTMEKTPIEQPEMTIDEIVAKMQELQAMIAAMQKGAKR